MTLRSAIAAIAFAFVGLSPSIGAAMCNMSAIATDPTLTSTASGLRYKVIREGSGTPPTGTDTVKVNYEGTLTDGTKFDSSYDRGKPISFPLNGVIAGWTEGLQLMQPGAEYCFVIPSDLAYGARGIPGVIPANADLVFRVELLEVQ